MLPPQARRVLRHAHLLPGTTSPPSYTIAMIPTMWPRYYEVASILMPPGVEPLMASLTPPNAYIIRYFLAIVTKKAVFRCHVNVNILQFIFE